MAGRRAGEAALGAKADKPKRYEPAARLQDFAAERRIFESEVRRRLRSRTGARMLARRVGRGMPPRQIGTKHVNSSAATLVIRERLRQHLLPHHEPRRRQGEYAGGCLCDGCGERITSAQASYEVDFEPGITPQSLRLHRACFEIWLGECQSQPLS